MVEHSSVETVPAPSFAGKDAASEQSIARYDGAFFVGFVLALLLCWSPSKLIGYAAPWIVIAWFLLASRSRVSLRNLLVAASFWLIALLLSALLTPGYAFHSAILSLLTYGSFFAIAAIPPKFVGSRRLFERMLPLARWLVLFQGSWGIVQAFLAASRTGTFDSSTGDAVAGTIHPFGMASDLSNPIFAINMSFLLLLLLPSLLQERKGKIAVAVGALSLVLASVLHALLFLAAALAVAVAIVYPTLLFNRRGIMLLAGFALAAALALTVLSDNFRTIRNFVQYTVEGETPRAQVVLRVFDEMPGEYPWMTITGLGPGQFGSRAGLIGTEMYFGTPANPLDLPLMPAGMSEPFEKYVLDLWISLFFDRYGNYVHTMDNTSSTVQPFFSWLSIYSEFGLFVFAAIGVLVIWFILKMRVHSRAPSERLRAVAFATGVIFLFLLGAQENYWEVPQAILPGLLILKAQYAHALYHS